MLGRLTWGLSEQDELLLPDPVNYNVRQYVKNNLAYDIAHTKFYGLSTVHWHHMASFSKQDGS